MLETNVYKSKETDKALCGQNAAVYMETMSDNIIKIKNHLGEFEFSADHTLRFESGLVGFQDVRDFALAKLPYEGMEQFKLLQSLEVPELCFIVMPTGAQGSPLEEADVEEICKNFKIDPQNLALLFIVTIRNLGGSMKVTMNARAPIILDTVRKTGRQFILPNQKYSIQHDL